MRKKIYSLLIMLVMIFFTSLTIAGDRTFLITGYIDWQYSQTQEKPGTFDSYHFNPIFRFQALDNLTASTELEFEHGGEEIMVEYAKIDYILSDYITIVGGKFLVPFGTFNERIHPTWINKIPGRPLSNDKIVPTGWSEVGAMFTGAFPLGSVSKLSYHLYLVNGLHGKDGDGIRDLRGNNRDTKHNDKSFGGRFGIVPVSEVEIGFSGYKGAYTDDAGQYISLYGADAEWKPSEFLDFRGEYNYALQGVAADLLHKKGYYLQGALKLSFIETESDFLYSILNPLEIALRYSEQDFPGETDDLKKTSAGINYYIGSSSALRLAYHINRERSVEKDNNEITFQFVLGL